MKIRITVFITPAIPVTFREGSVCLRHALTMLYPGLDRTLL